MMAAPTVAMGCSLLIVMSSTPSPVPGDQPRRGHAEVVAPAVGRVRLEPTLDHIDRHVEAHDAQRHGDRRGHVVERAPIANGAGEDEVADAGAQVVADDAGEVLEEDPLGRIVVEVGRLEPRQPVEVDRRVGDPPPLELLGDLGGDGRLAAPVHTGDHHPSTAISYHRTRVRDWVDWHAAYADPGSSISRGWRWCAGGSASTSTRRPGPREHPQPLRRRRPRPLAGARRPSRRVRRRPSWSSSISGSPTTPAGVLPAWWVSSVRQTDAGDPAAFADVLPVDLLLLCGIFGNISDADIRVNRRRRPGNARSRWDGDLDEGSLRGRPISARSSGSWVIDAGLLEVAFDGEPEPLRRRRSAGRIDGDRRRAAAAALHVHAMTSPDETGRYAHEWLRS